jgi:FAD/FMN-containing dehydrogenase
MPERRDDMKVLFLALGNYRRRAVIDEAADVLADGGVAVVLVGDMRAWQEDVFPTGAEIVDIASLESDHLPLRIERKLVYGLPRKLVKVAGRGRLRRSSKRALKAYERRIARPVHRRLTAGYRRIWKDRRHQRTMQFVLGREFDYINVTDCISIPAAARIISDLGTPVDAAPKISFGIDYI